MPAVFLNIARGHEQDSILIGPPTSNGTGDPPTKPSYCRPVVRVDASNVAGPALSFRANADGELDVIDLDVDVDLTFE
jgi:hypothetical protein